jgi:C1A family cysteine protease
MPKKKKTVKRILNCIPSRETERDWRIENAVGAKLMAARPAIPPSKDLREDWWKIGNQESTGSCVGWATADSVLRWHFVKANWLPKNRLLSPRFIWMASKETDQFVSQPTTFIETEGTSLKSALDIARKFGVVPDSVLPFASGKLYPGEAQTFYALAAQLKIASYFNLSTNLGNWRTWLATKGPILTRLGVDVTWDNADATHGNLDVYKPDTVRGGHAVALVGYTRDRFIVRNRWGMTWGDKGYGYASLEYAQAAFTETYGVTL